MSTVMRAVVLPITLIVALGIVVGYAPAQMPADNRIVPGERMGQWSLSTPLDALVSSMGANYNTITATGVPRTNAYNFNGQNASVIFCLSDRRPFQIGIYRAQDLWGRDLGWKEPLRDALTQYKTAEGIGLDSLVSAVSQAYGQLVSTYDWGRGFKGYVLRNRLFFNADPEGKVSYISVFAGESCR